MTTSCPTHTYKDIIDCAPQETSDIVFLENCTLYGGVKNTGTLSIIDTKILACTKSIGQSFTAAKSILLRVEATHSLTLTETSAQTVITTAGILSIGHCKKAYNFLKAPHIISKDIAATRVVCTERIKAKKCTFGLVESGNKVRIKDSVIRKSLQVRIDNKSRLTLHLQNTVIDGDLIIRGLPSIKPVEENIVISGKNSLGVGKLVLTNGASHTYQPCIICRTIKLPENYRILEDVPEGYKEYFINQLGEGGKGKLGTFKCVVKNGRLQLDVPEVEPKSVIDSSAGPVVLTLSTLKHRLRGLTRPGQSAERIDFMGGIFQVLDGRLCMIKAPPSLNLISQPHVEVKIIGGIIKGNIIFKDCRGQVNKIYGTSTTGGVSAAIVPQAKIDNNNNNANIPALNVPQLVPEEKNEPIVEARPAEKKEIPVFPDDPNDDDFMDPITLDKISNPYRTPTKPQTHAFEYDSLVLLCKGKDHFTCPLTDKVFKLADCKPDLAMKAHIEKLSAEKG